MFKVQEVCHIFILLQVKDFDLREFATSFNFML